MQALNQTPSVWAEKCFPSFISQEQLVLSAKSQKRQYLLPNQQYASTNQHSCNLLVLQGPVKPGVVGKYVYMYIVGAGGGNAKTLRGGRDRPQTGPGGEHMYIYIYIYIYVYVDIYV